MKRLYLITSDLENPYDFTWLWLTEKEFQERSINKKYCWRKLTWWETIIFLFNVIKDNI